MTSRKEQIQAMIEKDPEDVFLRYSLGMELASQKGFEQATEQFKKCIELDENYLPAYVECGKCLRSAARFDGAREVFAAGMELAAMQGETHVRDFIQQQLDGLPKAL